MKIQETGKKLYLRELHDMTPGDVVQFNTRFNDAHDPNAYFLVLKVPGEYIAEKKRRDRSSGIYRVMVANVETGLTSLVLADRTVRFVKAEVTVGCG